jgi:hypothetical protein
VAEEAIAQLQVARASRVASQVRGTNARLERKFDQLYRKRP